MIDIIIPAFNAHDTIEDTLNSLSLQVAKEYITVTIVNDNGKNYNDIVARFKDKLNIKELHKRVNGGAGLARQYGIDKTKNPFIAFVDADDILPDIFTLHQQFAHLMNDEKCVMVTGNFLEETPDGRYIGKHQDTTYMHGKMYRRSHIEKNHIHFSDLRLCEDVEFNMRIKLNMTTDEHLGYLTDKYYYVWKKNVNSITRRDVDQFPYYDIILAGVEASYRALKTPYENVRQQRGEIMNKVMEMFNAYVLLLTDKPDKIEWREDLLKAFRRYWKDIAKPVYDNAPKPEIARMFLNRDKGNVEHIIPTITFHQFVELLENE